MNFSNANDRHITDDDKLDGEANIEQVVDSDVYAYTDATLIISKEENQRLRRKVHMRWV